jgi:hypothetical protein
MSADGVQHPNRRPLRLVEAGAVPAVGEADLFERLAPVCVSAVEPLEIVAALEAEGLNDQTVHARYGRADVFELGEEMWRRTARQPAEPEPMPDPWRQSWYRHVLHGLMYGLPAVCFPAATTLLAGSGALRLLLVSMLTSWALSQGLAHLGYARLGRLDSVGARRVLRAGMVAGMLVLAAVLAATALLVPVSASALAFALGQGGYMFGAAVLLTLGADRLVFVSLAPGVLGGAGYLLAGRPPGLEHAVWCALAATPLLALSLAAMCTSGTGSEPGASAVPTAAELLGASTSAAFGFLAAALLAFPIAVGILADQGARAAALLAPLPLSLSMGAAEWSLVWYRTFTQRRLRNTDDLRWFATTARLALVAAVLQYLFVAALLIAAVVTVATESGFIPIQPALLPELGAYLALGGAMFLALLLQAFGGRSFTLLACAAALAVEFALRSSLVSAQIVGAVGLFAVLGMYAFVVLGRSVRHAY